jgi:hypothetical protein
MIITDCQHIFLSTAVYCQPWLPHSSPFLLVFGPCVLVSCFCSLQMFNLINPSFPCSILAVGGILSLFICMVCPYHLNPSSFISTTNRSPNLLFLIQTFFISYSIYYLIPHTQIIDYFTRAFCWSLS